MGPPPQTVSRGSGSCSKLGMACSQSGANQTGINKRKKGQKIDTLLDLCVSSLRRGHANLLCIVPILTDDLRRESKSKSAQNGTWSSTAHQASEMCEPVSLNVGADQQVRVLSKSYSIEQMPLHAWPHVIATSARTHTHTHTHTHMKCASREWSPGQKPGMLLCCCYTSGALAVKARQLRPASPV